MTVDRGETIRPDRRWLFAGHAWFVLVTGMFCATASAQPGVDPGDLIFDLPADQRLAFPGSVMLPTVEQLRNVQIDPAVRALVLQMEDPAYEAREQASRHLIDLRPDRMQLYALLIPGRDLSPEQRYRLIAVLRETLVRTPRGALGISSNPMVGIAGGPMEIRVTDLVPGLPAERVLRVGDRISHIDGQPMVTFNDLLVHVQSKRPGDKVTLSVKRGRVDPQGRPIMDVNNEQMHDRMEIEIELGSADMLRTFNQSNNMHQPMSPVESQRMLEAERAARELAPAPRQVRMGDPSAVSRSGG